MGRVLGPVLSGGVSLIAALAALSPAIAQDVRTPLFTADVNLVTIPVTVRDESGPLADLAQADFAVFEGGQEVEISVFERSTDRPLSVVLMLDTSLSTAIQLSYEKESAKRFLEQLLSSQEHPQDVAAVYSFSSEVAVLEDFTRNRKALGAALGRARPQTGTSVYDAISLASEELARRTGRRVIVLITDGGDTTSFASFDDAMRSAHFAEAAIYPLIVLPIRSDAGRNRGGEHALMTLASKTGGEAFVQHGVEDLDAAFDEVLRSLRTQYLLGFYPRSDTSETRGILREVQVRVRHEGATVLARSGYYEREPAPERARPSSVQSPSAPVAVPSRPRTANPAEEPPAPLSTPPARAGRRPGSTLRPKP